MAAHTVELQAEARTTFRKHVRALRRKGIVPANIFGHGPSQAIQAPARALEHMLSHGGRSAVINIGLGQGPSHTALLKNLTRDPKSGSLLHLDFQAVSMDETVTTAIPVHVVGQSPAVTKAVGVLTHQLTELRIEALARDLPDGIDVDISTLEAVHDAIHVRDVVAPSGTTLLDPEDEIVVAILPSKQEQAAEAEAEAPAEESPAAAESASEG